MVHTESEDDAAAFGEDAHRADVFDPQGILDGGGKQTGGTEDHGALDASLEGIDWVVLAIIVTVGRHLGVNWRGINWTRDSRRMGW